MRNFHTLFPQQSATSLSISIHYQLEQQGKADAKACVMIESQVFRTKSWSRAGVMGDYRHRQSHSSSSPKRRLLPKSRFEGFLKDASTPLYERVQKALEAEEREQSSGDASQERVAARPSFYFRCQSRKDVQRQPPDVPDVGNYSPKFEFVHRRNPVCSFSKAVLHGPFHSRKLALSQSYIVLPKNAVRPILRVRRKPVVRV